MRIVRVALPCLLPGLAFAQGEVAERGLRAVTPWVAGDLGAGGASVGCIDCSLWYGGFALTGAVSAGATVRGGLSLVAQLSGLSVPVGGSRNTGSFRLLTLAVPATARLHLKAGLGTGRYTLGPTQLVDDRLAGLIGVELRRASRHETAFVELLQTARGAAVMQNEHLVQYRFRALRVGVVYRLRFRREGEP